ncbi:alkaline phosphatase D family protein [Luteolibacter marinus]|uniref:alkaline phosphatase D family protein n=1 Tax=Luteolibacter marinus TaxID=2776705 RepID=UPI001868AFD4|nr:alkaline phosphatase D family protein [Luteolibacter marinus]
MRIPPHHAILAAGLAIAPVPAAEIASGPWCGAVTPDAIAVTAHLDGAGIQARLVVSAAPDFSNPVYSPTVQSSGESGNNVRLDLSGLAPDRRYHYALELDGILQTDPARTGTFKTLPAAGPASFRFAFSSCTYWNEPGQFVFDAIRNEDVRFFIAMGDLNYKNTNVDDPDAYRDNYIDMVTESTQFGEMVRKLPIAYIWDDHDYSGNTSDRNSTGRTAHRLVYREAFPHYPLPAGGPDEAIYQTFDCGRVRFLLTDLRSERNPSSQSDGPGKSMMGGPQKQWFKDQLVAARDGGVPLMVWVSSVPFIGTIPSTDHWSVYKTERLELLNFIKDENIRNLIVIAGDMHALAYDDGTATADYVEGVHVPVFHAASLTRDGSSKGGPYSGGESAGGGRYGIFDIVDNGATIAATYHGRIAASATSVSTWKSYTYTTYSGAYRDWKLANLGDADAPDDGDDDHDGITTAAEFVYDLNPNLPDRYEWQASAPDPESGDVTVSFPTSPGRSYRVYFSESLAAWTPGSGLIPGDGSTLEWTDQRGTQALPQKRFYRVVASAAP